MIPCLYASTETKFDHNGIGKLADAQSCTVTEKRNGSYELKLVCPADGIHAEMLEEVRSNVDGAAQEQKNNL